eukprot:6619847-Pyramimonas_sp.AAC.1
MYPKACMLCDANQCKDLVRTLGADGLTFSLGAWLQWASTVCLAEYLPASYRAKGSVVGQGYGLRRL